MLVDSTKNQLVMFEDGFVIVYDKFGYRNI